MDDKGLSDIQGADGDQDDRHKRIDWWDQRKVSSATVMVVGAGALGNEVAKNLAQCGVGKLIIVDFDRVELSNLNRCIFFNKGDSDKHRYKAEVMAKRIHRLFPRVKTTAIVQDVDDLDERIYTTIDIAVSGVDSVDARLTINSHCFEYGVPLVDGGTLGTFGNVQVVLPPTTACLQCDFQHLTLEQRGIRMSCSGQLEHMPSAPLPALSTTTSIIGGIQAMQVVKLLHFHDFFKVNGKWPENVSVLTDKWFDYDGFADTARLIQVSINPRCQIHNDQDVTLK